MPRLPRRPVGIPLLTTSTHTINQGWPITGSALTKKPSSCLKAITISWHRQLENQTASYLAQPGANTGTLIDVNVGPNLISRLFYFTDNLARDSTGKIAWDKTRYGHKGPTPLTVLRSSIVLDVPNEAVMSAEYNPLKIKRVFFGRPVSFSWLRGYRCKAVHLEVALLLLLEVA